MTAFSILDLAPVVEGATVQDALHNSLRVAQLADELGYTRYWFAEHHNMPAIGSAATSVVIGFVVQGTKRIRVGSGGIMLPNHAPLLIAEQFGTLASLYPDRIDLGVGRAPGTDQLTMRALRRHPSSAAGFPDDVAELIALLEPAQPGQRIHATPGEGTRVPVWILGSSTFGARFAAKMGLPYAFASHFAPKQLYEALETYRNYFEPSSFLEHPYAIVAANTVVAPTEDKARFLFTSAQQVHAALAKNQRGKIPHPVQDIVSTIGHMGLQVCDAVFQKSLIGTPEQVREKTKKLIQETGAQEIMICDYITDQPSRLRSYELFYQAVHDL